MRGIECDDEDYKMMRMMRTVGDEDEEIEEEEGNHLVFKNEKDTRKVRKS